MIKNNHLLLMLVRAAISEMETFHEITDDCDLAVMSLASQAQLQAIRKKLEDDN